VVKTRFLGLVFVLVCGVACQAHAGPCDAVLGKWEWFTKGVVTIKSDGTMVHELGNDGTWKCTDDSRSRFTLRWRVGGYVNSLALSADGQQLSSTDPSQSYVTATRIGTPPAPSAPRPSPPPAAADAKVNFDNGLAYSKKRMWDEAIGEYGKAIRTNPKYALAYLNRGAAYHEKRDYDRSIADFTKALELEPTFVGANFNRGASYLANGQYDEAIADFTKAISWNPKAAYNNRGNAYYTKGEYAKALGDLEKAQALGHNVDATRLDELRKATQASKQPTQAVTPGDSQEITRLVARLSQNYKRETPEFRWPSDEFFNDGYIRKGHSLSLEKDFTLVRRYLECDISDSNWEGISKDGPIPAAYRMSAASIKDCDQQRHGLKWQEKTATLSLRQVRPLSIKLAEMAAPNKGPYISFEFENDQFAVGSMDCKNAVVCKQIVADLTRLVQNAHATQPATRPQQTDPSASKNQDALAAARRLMNDRKWFDAIPLCGRAINLAPKSADGYHCRADARLRLFEAKHLYRWELAEKLRGQSLEQQKDLQLITADCSAAIQLAPAVSDSYAVCGKAHRYAGDLNASLANYSKLAQLRSSDADGYHQSGLTKTKSRDLRGAVTAFTKAIELNPKLILGYVDRGLASQQLADYGGAIADFTKALELLSGLKDLRQFPIDSPLVGISLARAKAKRATGDALGADQDIIDAYRKDGGAGFTVERIDILQALTAMIQRRPKDGELYATRAEIWFDKKDWTKARDDYTKIIEVAPRLETIRKVYFKRGVAQMHLGSAEKAQVDFNEVIKSQQRDTIGLDAYLGRAEVRSLRGDLAGAMADATAVLNSIGWEPSMNPTNTVRSTRLLNPFEWTDLAKEALLARGEFYRRMGDLNKASADLTWVINHDPMAADPTGMVSQAAGLRGLVLVALGKDAAAQQDLATCREDEPEYFESKIKPELAKLLNARKSKPPR